MKRILAVLLAGLMLLSLTACGGKDNVVKRGALEMEGEGLFVSEEHEAHRKEEDGVSSEATYERVNYSNLSAALMDLENGKIIKLSVTESVANYVAAHNDKFTVSVNKENLKNFSMMTSESNTKVYDILNNAIKAMKEDGTLDSLMESELMAYINSDPEPKDLPHFDGARTIKIGVTGDLPPMDFVAANGKAAGFNIALLTEIANRAQVNIEIVQVTAGNVSAVGGLAGVAKDASLINIDVAFTDDSIVEGLHYAGGLVGFAYGNNKLKNIVVTNPNVLADTRTEDEDRRYYIESAQQLSSLRTQTATDINKTLKTAGYSYAGGVAGFVDNYTDQNNKGFENLCRIMSNAEEQGKYYKPRTDHDELKKYNYSLSISHEKEKAIAFVVVEY